ncbi:hypothetical protein V1478_003985 [Vespula squamosa]|uniref:Uncharacterized protein n=1 Tax=Vespula squamosa TaxID=30214 RepID=A0ABD2BNF1_VESSQ
MEERRWVAVMGTSGRLSRGILRSQGGESTPPREISSEKPAGIASSEQELSPAVNLDINQRRHTASEETR